MKKLLIIVRDRQHIDFDYTKFWDYIRELDPHYAHYIDYVVLIDTDKSIDEIKSRIIGLYGSILQFIVVDVTESDRDGWCAKSFWDKWRKDTETTLTSEGG